MNPVTTLSNGVRVMNFSSPHAFTFEDGSILEACSPELSNRGKLEAVEVEYPHEELPIVDISLEFKISDEMVENIRELEKFTDVLIVSLPVMTAMKARGEDVGKMRVIRGVDRITKAVSITKFCI